MNISTADLTGYSHPTKNMDDIRDVVSSPKYFGRHQIVQFMFISAANLLNALHLVSAIFLSADVPFR